ncbi:hypothetical protein AB1I68_30305 [Paenibacillus pabuli]
MRALYWTALRLQMNERFAICGRLQSGQPMARPQRRQRMERIHGIC